MFTANMFDANMFAANTGEQCPPRTLANNVRGGLCSPVFAANMFAANRFWRTIVRGEQMFARNWRSCSPVLRGFAANPRESARTRANSPMFAGEHRRVRRKFFLADSAANPREFARVRAGSRRVRGEPARTIVRRPQRRIYYIEVLSAVICCIYHKFMSQPKVFT